MYVCSMDETSTPVHVASKKDLTFHEVQSTLIRKRFWLLACSFAASTLWSILSYEHFIKGRSVEFSDALALMAIPWAFLIGWYLRILLKARSEFWKQLAVKKGWTYEPTADVSHEKAAMFHIGHSRVALNNIEGSYKDDPFRIFEYTYIVGHGKSSRAYRFTIFEIKFEGTFPHVYLNRKGDLYSHVSSMKSSLTKLPVPNEFEKAFELYAPQKYEVEALQIFTPDVFALLLDKGWNYEMEFVDGELVIYKPAQLQSLRDLESELQKVQEFVDVLAPKLNHMRLTQIGNHSPILTKHKD